MRLQEGWEERARQRTSPSPGGCLMLRGQSFLTWGRGGPPVAVPGLRSAYLGRWDSRTLLVPEICCSSGEKRGMDQDASVTCMRYDVRESTEYMASALGFVLG